MKGEIKAKGETYLQLALKFQRTKCDKTFTKLYQRLVPGLRNYTYNITEDWDAADDVVAITMSRVYTKIDDYDPTYQITTWAYKIARNEALQWIRRRDEVLPLSIFSDSGYDADESGNIGKAGSVLESNLGEKCEEDYIEEDKKLQSVYECAMEEIFNLKPAYRQIMIDRFIHRLSYKEIEEKTNHPFKLKCAEMRKNIKSLEEEGKATEAVKAKINLQRYIKNCMINMQTVKNRINRGKKMVVENLEAKKIVYENI